MTRMETRNYLAFLVCLFGSNGWAQHEVSMGSADLNAGKNIELPFVT